MYVVLAEDKSDVNCLRVLIKLLEKNESITVEGKGFNSCGNMLNKGAAYLKLYNEQNKFYKIIICHDRDKNSSQDIYNKVVSKIINNVKIKSDKLICILIPTEEIEAWILADIKAVSNILSWQPKHEFPNPEEIESPKEKLTKLAKLDKSTYIHNIHNEKVVKHLDLTIVKKKCSSFAELADFVEHNIANYPRISK
jgi:hypothetical protein